MGNVAYAVVYGCIIAAGLPLNVLSLWTLLRRHGLRSPNVVFMVNLAVSDLLLIVTLPVKVYLYATGTWPLGKGWCLLITIFFYDNLQSSAYFITFISVDRLLAVAFPLKARHLRTASNALKGAALVWLLVALMSIPQSLALSRRLRGVTANETTCLEFQHQGRERSAVLYVQTALVFLLMTVNVACTAVVSRVLHSRSRSRSSGGGSVSSAQVENKVNAMLIFMVNMTVFTVCFLPLTVGLLVLDESNRRPLICLACLNCCMDPILYYFSLDAFWRKKDEVDKTGKPKTIESHF